MLNNNFKEVMNCYWQTVTIMTVLGKKQLTLLLANCYNNDSSKEKATDLHLTSCYMSSRVNLTTKNKAVNLVVL